MSVMLAGVSASAQGPVRPKAALTERMTCVIGFDIAGQPMAKSLFLKVVVPQTIENRQTVHGITYSIEPTKTLTENDVKYAVFELSPPLDKLTLSITVDLELTAPAATLNLKPPKRPKKPAKPDEKGEDEFEKFLVDERYLEQDSPEIKKAAATIRGADEEAVRNIAVFVANHLKYTKFTKEAKGATEALKSGSGDCTEFSDLFTTLCRAKGTPARTAYGFLTEWKPGGTPTHAWVEVYLKKHGWTLFDAAAAATPGGLTGTRPTYLQLSTVRNDPELLNEAQFYYYKHTGDVVKVKDYFTVTSGGRTKSTRSE